MPSQPEDRPEGEGEEEEEEIAPPDRPLECGECKRPITVHYTEIVGDTITVTGMCAECPELQKRLHGTPRQLISGAGTEGGGLACGNCGTTLESVKRGHDLGCRECYNVFDDVLLPELVSTGTVPPRLATARKAIPLHLGRAPGEVQEISP